MHLALLVGGGRAHETVAQLQLLLEERPDLERSAAFRLLRQTARDLASASDAPRAPGVGNAEARATD